MKWNRRNDVGQAANLAANLRSPGKRGSWPIDNRPQVDNLPHIGAGAGGGTVVPRRQ